MIKNYLKIAWRNIWKNKVFSAINIIGLSVGMAACIVIMLFVSYEKSFDNFHTKNIYKLDEVQKFPGMVSSQKVGLSMFPMGPTLQLKTLRASGGRKNSSLHLARKGFLFPKHFLLTPLSSIFSILS
jgi:hypothetical protein